MTKGREEMQDLLNALVEALSASGMELNMEKTLVMRVQGPVQKGFN
jgi:hypothetical protein